MNAENSYYYHSPLGWMRIRKHGSLCVAMDFVSKRPSGTSLLAASDELRTQLADYFKGKKAELSVPFISRGTKFQNKVWSALRAIAFGKTLSYSQVAERIGKKKSVRAVANAIGSNPWPILVPCHRVIGKNGALTGYAYGLKKKKWLLEHERQKNN